MTWTMGSGFICAAILASGCTPAPCDSALDPNGARYQVDIDGIYDTTNVYSSNEGWTVGSGTPSCGGADGLGPGATLQIKTVGQSVNNNSACQAVNADLIAAPAALTIGGVSATTPPMVRDPQVVMYAVTDVTFAGCEGTSVLEFFAGPGNVFAPPNDAGILQPAVMYRLFQPSSGSCALCQDNFVVQLFDGTTGGD